MTFFPRENLMRPVEGGAFVAANAVVTGEVTLGEDAGVWFGCVLRGDDAPLIVGARTNIQDLTMIHADPGVPNVIGSGVTVGHRVVLHGATVEDDCLIGMGSILLSGSVVRSGSIVAAGAVVKENFEVPAGTLVAGVPAKVMREVRPEELASIRSSAEGYVTKIGLYRS